MSDIHALSGAYAVDALDDAERAQFEEHLATCPECRAEVRSFRETSALLAEAESEAPPADLRAHVLADIRNVRPLPPEVPDATPDETSPTSPARDIATARSATRRWFPAMVAAAVAVILLATGALVWHPWSTSQSTSLADQIIHAPDAVHVSETLPGGAGKLTVWRSPSLGRAVMVADHVPAPPAGRTYQLWLQQPGAGMVSAGLMPDTSVPTVLTGDAATAKAAAITVEPVTGSAHPTSAPIALFPFGSKT